MAEPINARDMVTDIARKVEDEDLRNVTAAQILAEVDKASNYLFMREAQHFKRADLDYLDFNAITSSLFKKAGQRLLEMRLPDEVLRIEHMNDSSDGENPKEIIHGDMAEYESLRRTGGQRPRFIWFWRGGQGMRSRIALYPGDEIRQFRLWFLRRYPSMHYGTVKTGSDATKLVLDVDPTTSPLTVTGKTTLRDDAYAQALVQFTDTQTLAVHDQVRRLDTFVGSTFTATFDEDLPSTPVADQTLYAMLPRQAPEHHELIVQMAAMRIAEDLGLTRTMEFLGPKHNLLMEAFDQVTTVRQAATDDYVIYRDAEQP